jgi:hypothetical protein
MGLNQRERLAVSALGGRVGGIGCLMNGSGCHIGDQRQGVMRHPELVVGRDGGARSAGEKIARRGRLALNRRLGAAGVLTGLGLKLTPPVPPHNVVLPNRQ